MAKEFNIKTLTMRVFALNFWLPIICLSSRGIYKIIIQIQKKNIMGYVKLIFCSIYNHKIMTWISTIRRSLNYIGQTKSLEDQMFQTI